MFTVNRSIFANLSSKSGIGLALRLSVGLGLLAAAIYFFDWSRTGEALRMVREQPGWAGSALGLVWVTLFLKLLRWGRLLRDSGVPLGWTDLGRAYFLGQAANILLPFRGGEAVRIGLATWYPQLVEGLDSGEEMAVRIAAPAASIGVEKVLDFLLFTVCLGLVSADLPGWSFNGPWMGLGLSGMVLVFLFGFPLWWQRWGEKHAGRCYQVMTRLNEVARSVTGLRKLGTALVLTILIWIVMLGTNLLMMRAVGLPFDQGGALRVLVLVYIGVAPAIMPGNIGPFLFCAGLGLAGRNYPPGTVGAFALLLYLAVTIPPLFLAGCWLIMDQRARGRL